MGNGALQVGTQASQDGVETLQDRIAAAGGPLGLLRSAGAGPLPFPVKSEFSNWRDEQESWRRAAVLFDQSHHMTDSTIEGPDAYRFLAQLAVNSFNGFGPTKAKQLVVCGPHGYVIGDGVAFCLADNHVRVVGRAPIHSWLKYHAESGDCDITYSRDERTVRNPDGRELYRFQVNGPNAREILERVNGGPLPEIPFFTIGQFHVGPHQVTALNHRMSGFPGLEFWGPYAQADAVRELLLEAGADLGLRQAGAKAYSTTAVESGWIAQITPAIYSGDQLRPYREWLKAQSFEANVNLAGSFVSDRIEDYYATPWDLGYGFIVKHDHDFIGSDALKRMADQPHRQKAWLYWHRDDVVRIFASMYEQGDRRFKYLEMPAGWYGSMQYDRIESADGSLIGVSRSIAYSSNIRGWLSLSMVDERALDYGAEVQLVWGEPDGGSANPAVERHAQTRIRATLGRKPFSEVTEGSSLR
jgi:glycine cleavage system aminomethyltransferase T